MAKQRLRLVEVPFSKTDCGVDFYINTARGDECLWVLTEHKVFKTDFFEIFFIKKAYGYVLRLPPNGSGRETRLPRIKGDWMNCHTMKRMTAIP